MAERVLTRAELNRALLARQLLLERRRMTLPRAERRIPQRKIAELANAAVAELRSGPRTFEEVRALLEPQEAADAAIDGAPPAPDDAFEHNPPSPRRLHARARRRPRESNRRA